MGQTLQPALGCSLPPPSSSVPAAEPWGRQQAHADLLCAASKYLCASGQSQGKVLFAKVVIFLRFRLLNNLSF